MGGGINKQINAKKKEIENTITTKGLVLPTIVYRVNDMGNIIPDPKDTLRDLKINEICSLKAKLQMLTTNAAPRTPKTKQKYIYQINELNALKTMLESSK